jgi:Calx-beta domain
LGPEGRAYRPPPPPPPPPPANDNFANATVLIGAGSISGSSVNATKQAGEPNHAGNTGGASIWYRITPTVSGIATIDTTGSGFDTLLGVYTGSSVSGLTTRASNDDLAYPLILQSLVQLSVTAGVPYYIAVDGWNGANGAVTLNWDITGSGTTTTTTSTSTTTTTSTSTSTTTTTTSLPSAPTISIADASVFEGRGGRRNMSFTVSLSSAAAGTVTVHYETADGTATSGSDYQSKSGTVSISAGATSATITIKIYGDRTPEPNETFSVNLSNASGATIADATATGTILNDD